MMHSVTGS